MSITSRGSAQSAEGQRLRASREELKLGVFVL
ncbi:predicted protein [Sclerotinia sclerotiorum 1980 UF-70]|uniref:Uncharacterized protein n=1 Tax=Sclerotinia sclerotiorum (strain ATCC 18683 / 1980 / Ss-1) TaxID=665079 RepID=A7EPZ3_SCLS1|nr:predicted protein [Sclerotinia sclerotiorum 1980 UF-70]EDO04909.1 predicted protein [Sclerotinia sclerotiorum 1980 UF-70]